MTTYYGMSGARYNLDKCIGKGGEGEIYEVTGNCNYVAKLYNEKKFTPNATNLFPREELCEKVKTMVKQKVDPYVNGVLTIAWPQDALFDYNKKFVGYIMHKTKSHHHLFDASRKRERGELFPKYTWKTAITLAYNLALVTKRLHDAEVIIGDFNANNVMINEEGYITLIDTDSFTIRNSETGRIFKCTVGVPDVLAPELQGKNLALKESIFSKESDRFALAIHIFILLANNCHPFGYIDATRKVSASHGNLIVNNIVHGVCPYVEKNVRLSPEAPNMNIFPEDIFGLFQKAFLYNKKDATNIETLKRRPSAEEWQKSLGKLLVAEMKTCRCNSGHVYPKHLRKCPWCEIENRVNNVTALTIKTVTSTNSNSNTKQIVQCQSNNILPQQGLTPLMIASILVGMLFGVLLGPYAGEILNSELQIGFDNATSMLVFGMVGGVSGVPVALIFRKQYCALSAIFPGIMLSLLSPISFLVIVAVVVLAIYIVYMIIAGIMVILAVVAAGAIIAALFSSC